MLGVAAWLWLMITYSSVSDAGDVEAVASDRLNQGWFSVMALTCTFPIMVGAFVYAARDGMRRVYLRRALRPLGAVLALIGSAFGFVLGAAPEFQGFRDLIGLPGKIIGVLVLLWAIGFFLYGMVLVLLHVFRTADIHELVPPMLATALVWEMAILDLVLGTYAEVPLVTRIGFILGAPVSVTALSWWETHRLRHHHGLTLRGALRR